MRYEFAASLARLFLLMVLISATALAKDKCVAQKKTLDAAREKLDPCQSEVTKASAKLFRDMAAATNQEQRLKLSADALDLSTMCDTQYSAWQKAHFAYDECNGDALNPAAEKSSSRGNVGETAPKVKESCSKVSKVFGETSTLSTIQKSELWKQKYHGREFKWKVRFGDTAEPHLGIIPVMFFCADSEDMLIMFYSDSSKDKVLRFNKGKLYEVRGQFEQYSSMFGLGDHLTAVPKDDGDVRIRLQRIREMAGESSTVEN